MKKTLLIIFCLFGLFGYSQDEYYRIVDWKFYPENVIQLTDSTYSTDAIPFDYNDQGAIQRIIGGYVVDFIGHRYEVIDSTATTITVLDIYHTGQAPQTGQIARCYRSVYNGDSKYVGSVDYSPLDESARWKMNGSDNEILWRHGIDYEFPFKRLVLDTNYVHDGSEIKGTMAWEEATQSVETNIADDLHLNNGEELWVPLCYNNTTDTIKNGRPVYIDNVFGSNPAIKLASNITYEESRLIGVATQNIPPSAYGRVTRFGYVNGIDLTGCTAGSNVYLGDKILTHVRPWGGLFPVVIGKAIVCSTDGRLLVYPQSVEYTSESNRVKGWTSYTQGDQTNLSFVDGTRTLSITPVSGTYYFYQDGIKYIKSAIQSISITDVEGIHLVYFDLGVLYELVNPSREQTLDIIRNKVIVSAIYWDATNKVAIYVSNERHTFNWPSWVHAYAHTSFGTQYLSGLGLTNITLGSGASNLDAQFGSDSGSIVDEDIVTTTAAVSSVTGIPIYYRLGSGLGLWRRVTRSGYAFLNDGITGLAMYNLNSGGAWSIVSMTNNYYRLIHVFATNDIGTPNKIIAMSGVAQYSSAALAEAAVTLEIENIYNSNLPFSEVKHIGSLILHTKTGLGNSVLARYVAIPSKPTGSNYYMDFRKAAPAVSGGGGSTATSFLGLSDTPDSYAGQSNKIVGVNIGESGTEFKAATTTLAGTINIPTGQQYQINGGSIVVDAINDGVTTTAPSQNAVFDALALKAPSSVYPATGLTTGYIPYKTSTVLGNSPIWTNGAKVGIGTTSPDSKLTVTSGNIDNTITTYGLRVTETKTISGVDNFQNAGLNMNFNTGGTSNFTNSNSAIAGSFYNATSGTLTTQNALWFIVGNNASGSVGNVVERNGVRIQNFSTGTGGIAGTVTTSNGIHINDMAAYNSPTTTNGLLIDASIGAVGTSKYGIKIGNQSGATFNYAIYTGTGKIYFGDNVGIGITPTATLHLKAGTATANTAPLKFTSGTNLATTEAGAMEYNGTNLFFTPETTRKTIAYNPMTTGGDLIYGGASGVETRLANGTAGQFLKSNGTTLAPTWEATVPISGSANYVNVSPATAQTGNIWMGGTLNLGSGTLDNYILNIHNDDPYKFLFRAEYPDEQYHINHAGFGAVGNDVSLPYIAVENNMDMDVGIKMFVQDSAANTAWLTNFSATGKLPKLIVQGFGNTEIKSVTGNIYLNPANTFVGINNDNPESPLQIGTPYSAEIIGNTPVIRAIGIPQTTVPQTLLRLNRPLSGSGDIHYSSSVDFNLKAYASSPNTPNTQLDIALKSEGTTTETANVNVLTLRDNGYVGVGLDPLYRLDINGSVRTNNGSIWLGTDENFGIGRIGNDINLTSFDGFNFVQSGTNTNRLKITNIGKVIINELSGTGTRPLSILADGTLAPDDRTTGTLSGTNVTWDYSVKKNYNITLTGNTIITLTNVPDGACGTLYVTNAASTYTITFAGYVNSIDPYIRLASNMVITSGGSKSDDFTFKYNGIKLSWNGTLDRQ